MNPKEKGVALVTVLVVGVSLFLFTGVLVLVAQNGLRHARKQANEAKVEYLAEAGLEKALSALSQTPEWLNSDQSDQEFNDVRVAGGMFDIDQIIVDGGDRIVTSHGYIPSRTDPLAQITLRARVRLSPYAFRHALFSAGEFEGEGSAGTTVSGPLFASGGYTKNFNGFEFDTVAAKSKLYFIETPSDRVDPTLLSGYGAYVRYGSQVSDISLPDVNYAELVNPSNFSGQSIYILTPPTVEHPEGSLWAENGKNYYALKPSATGEEQKEEKLYLDISLINSTLGGASAAGSIIAVDFAPYFVEYERMEDELVITNSSGKRGKQGTTSSSIFAFGSQDGVATKDDGAVIEVSGANITFAPENRVALIAGDINIINSSGTVTVGTKQKPAIAYGTSTRHGSGTVDLWPGTYRGQRGHIKTNGSIVSAGETATVHGKGNGTTVKLTYNAKVLEILSTGFSNALVGGEYNVERRSVARSR